MVCVLIEDDDARGTVLKADRYLASSKISNQRFFAKPKIFEPKLLTTAMIQARMIILVKTWLRTR